MRFARTLAARDARGRALGYGAARCLLLALIGFVVVCIIVAAAVEILVVVVGGGAAAAELSSS